VDEIASAYGTKNVFVFYLSPRNDEWGEKGVGRDCFGLWN